MSCARVPSVVRNLTKIAALWPSSTFPIFESDHFSPPLEARMCGLVVCNNPLCFETGNGNQSKRPHSNMATTRTATLSRITTRTATLLWSKRPHCFGQNGHISWVATKTATLFWSKRPHSFWSKRPQSASPVKRADETSRFGFQNGLTAFSQNGHTLFNYIVLN